MTLELRRVLLFTCLSICALQFGCIGLGSRNVEEREVPGLYLSNDRGTMDTLVLGDDGRFRASGPSAAQLLSGATQGTWEFDQPAQKILLIYHAGVAWRGVPSNRTRVTHVQGSFGLDITHVAGRTRIVIDSEKEKWFEGNGPLPGPS